MRRILVLMPMIFLLMATPNTAQAGFWSLIQYIFGARPAKPAAPSCVQTNAGYRCTPREQRAPRLTQPKINEGRQRMREAGKAPVGRQGKCTTHANGCVDCPGAKHGMVLQSPRGRKIIIDKAGQNHLHGGIQTVLKRMADENGKNIRVTSGYRSCAYQSRTGQGVPKSQHLKGNAADFKFEGGGPTHSALANIARRTLAALGMGGGTGTYCSAPAHVDTGNNRQWNWCKKRTRMKK